MKQLVVVYSNFCLWRSGKKSEFYANIISEIIEKNMNIQNYTYYTYDTTTTLCSLSISHDFHSSTVYVTSYITVCVCVCVCQLREQNKIDSIAVKINKLGTMGNLHLYAFVYIFDDELRRIVTKWEQI